MYQDPVRSESSKFLIMIILKTIKNFLIFLFHLILLNCNKVFKSTGISQKSLLRAGRINKTFNAKMYLDNLLSMYYHVQKIKLIAHFQINLF